MAELQKHLFLYPPPPHPTPPHPPSPHPQWDGTQHTLPFLVIMEYYSPYNYTHVQVNFYVNCTMASPISFDCVCVCVPVCGCVPVSLYVGVFLCLYMWVCLICSGFIADKVNPRYFLTFGMLGQFMLPRTAVVGVA